jgi:hypothetical protein
MWQSFLNWFRQFSREQQVSVVVIFVCGFLAFGLSVYRLRLNVTAPFLVDKREIGNAKDIIGPTPAEEEAAQKRIDTDGDTLSDWDEVHVFQTNPNLRDTCGDGMPDSVRLAIGRGAGCSVGNEIRIEEGVNVQATAPLTIPGISNGFASTSLSAPVVSQDIGTTETALPRDPALIRQALQNKVDQAKLDALSDNELLSLYDQAIVIQAGQASSSTTAP